MKIPNLHNMTSSILNGECVPQSVCQVYGYSKERTLGLIKSTQGKIQQTKKEYVEFRNNFQKAFYSITEETVNEVLQKIEKFLKVEKCEGSSEGLKQSRQRIEAIVMTLYKEYLLNSRLVNSQVVQRMMKAGKEFNVNQVVPMYINLKATLIVSKEMLIEFVENCLSDMKLTYESSKDNVTMFIAGNFNEETLKKKISEGIDSLKDMTVKVVNKGLEIKISRKALVENYDEFAVKLLEMVKEMRHKGEENITQIKKKSKDLYKEVISRIRAKELEIRTNMKELCPITECSSIEQPEPETHAHNE